MRNFVVLYINGQRHQLTGKDVFMMLADFLRQRLYLTGTKIVCAEGDCGACTVLCAEVYSSQFLPINACIAMIATLDGAQIITIEGIKKNGQPSLVQESMVKCHASQCGYCTPGIVMALHGLKEKKPGCLNSKEVKNALTGNLCRCTGYQTIIDAALSLRPTPPSELFNRYEALKNKAELQRELTMPVELKDDGALFFAPITLKDACAIRKDYPGLQIVARATDMGVALNKGKYECSKLMSLKLIPNLHLIEEKAGRIKVGALTSLEELRHFCSEIIPELSRFLNIFASPQIKNVATLVGNIANGSPIADTWPFLLVNDAVVHIANSNSEYEIPLDKFYTGYKKNLLKADEIIHAISFKIPKQKQILGLYKVSRRKDLDISTVNAAFLFEIADDCIKEARLALGGVAATAVRLFKTEALLLGKKIDDEAKTRAFLSLQEEIEPIDDLRGSKCFRRALLKGILDRYWEEHVGAKP